MLKVCLALAGILCVDLISGTIANHLVASRTSASNGQPKWFSECLAEQAKPPMSFAPYVGWVPADFSGRCLHIANGLRLTYNYAQTSSIKPSRVFVFGGSTTWGFGSRDEHTIPSELARLAEQHGRHWEVVNRGQPAYVVWQNVINLADLCASGNHPDLVIFYNGANEVRAQFESPQQSRPLVAMNDWSNWHGANRSAGTLARFLVVRAVGQYKRRSLIAQLLRTVTPESKQDAGRAAGQAVDEYLQSVELVRALGREYHFNTLFVWQPVVFTKRAPSEGETRIMKSQDALGFAFEVANKRISERRDILNLTDVFGNSNTRHFLYNWHIDEEGNRIVANAIFERAQQLAPSMP